MNKGGAFLSYAEGQSILKAHNEFCERFKLLNTTFYKVLNRYWDTEEKYFFGLLSQKRSKSLDMFDCEIYCFTNAVISLNDEQARFFRNSLKLSEAGFFQRLFYEKADNYFVDIGFLRKYASEKQKMDFWTEEKCAEVVEKFLNLDLKNPKEFSIW